MGSLLLAHSLLLDTAVDGTINLGLMHDRQMMLICALGLLTLGAMGWLFGKKTPVPPASVYRSRVAILSGSFLMLLAVTTPSVNPRSTENTMLLAVLILGYGFSGAENCPVEAEALGGRLRMTKMLRFCVILLAVWGLMQSSWSRSFTTASGSMV